MTDVGVAELPRLKQLQALNIADTRVTDAGLKVLAVLKGLKTLELGGTKVTDDAALELQKPLPNLEVLW